MACLNQWIKSSDTRCCELCKYDFIMETQLKPLGKVDTHARTHAHTHITYCLRGNFFPQFLPPTTNFNVLISHSLCHVSSSLSLFRLSQWEKLQMSTGERRKIFCSVVFHLIAVICVLWSVQVLVKRTMDEISLGKGYGQCLFTYPGVKEFREFDHRNF